ncbi:hypothetical protein PIB30_021491 [Stylosanthes scabra]|uniref:F-box domain-containing protein n=1 Tax=Stylosanthes scabra TaxID=79078 RepID=A0ABU6Z8I8_9FABA|nr:hypothetical protein [Stylosanthes scabra]
MDRISGLPKSILHDILERLPDKDAAKTCVLSKSWRETWFSFPILSVCSKSFLSFHDLALSPKHPLWLGKLDIFIKYVNKRLMRLRDQHLTIKEVKLDLTYIIGHRNQVAHHIDRWIQIAIESGVEVLELCFTGGYMGNWYNFPLCLTKAKSLTKLVLSGGIRLDPAFLNHSLEFFSMKTLSLSHILFGDEGVMEHFISHCPLMEHLTLDFCNVDNPQSIGDPPGSRTYRVQSLSLHGLQKLKGANVEGILEVYIGAPNLQKLCYRAPAERDESFKLNLDSCTNLKCLSLLYLSSADEWLHELLYKIPYLESLMLHNCSLSERIKISGPQLKFFELSNCYNNVEEVNIDAPNLLSCNYMGDDKPVISFQRISDQLEVNAYIDMNRWHLYELREFFKNIKPQKITESLPILHVSSCPPSIKSVQLHFVTDKEAHYLPLMSWSLWNCFPESISFSLLPSFKMRAFILYFYEMLMGCNKCKCDGRLMHPKIWWHGLKVVKVTHSGRTYENVEDVKAMLNALPKPEPESDVEEFITFALEL